MTQLSKQIRMRTRLGQFQDEDIRVDSFWIALGALAFFHRGNYYGVGEVEALDDEGDAILSHDRFHEDGDDRMLRRNNEVAE